MLLPRICTQLLPRFDHNLVYLQLCYKARFQRQPITWRTFGMGTPEANKSLLWVHRLGCSAGGAWVDMDIDMEADCIGSCTSFCMHMTVLAKVVHCFSNNKPWVMSDIKWLLNRKKTRKDRNVLILNTNKSKEKVLDFCRCRPLLQGVSMSVVDIKVV